MLARIARPGLVNDAPRPPASRARSLPPRGAERAQTGPARPARAPGWSDDDRLWDALAPALAAPARRAVAETEVAAILEATRPPSAARVLELGCGAGAHAVAFAARGFRVTGVDRSATLLEAAGRAAAEAGVEVELLRADFRTFSRPAAFDLACSLNASFAYFDDATHRRLLRLLRRSLRGGGSLVLDTLGEGRAAWSGDAATHEIGGARYSVRRAFDESRGVLREEWTVERGGRPETFLCEQRLFTAAELTALAEEAGFAHARASSTLDGAAPYDARSLRLVLLAQRPASSGKGPSQGV